MLLRAGIPMWQHHDSLLPTFETRICGKISRVYSVVLAVRRIYRGCEPQPRILDTEVGGRRVREELRAVFDGAPLACPGAEAIWTDWVTQQVMEKK